MAFPKLNMASYWTFLLSGVFIVACYFVPFGSAGAGWTTYPPLSTNVGTPGWGQTLVIIAIFATGSATIMGSINYVTTVIRLRAPGMGYFNMPLTVWGLWLTAILNVLFVPVRRRARRVEALAPLYLELRDDCGGVGDGVGARDDLPVRRLPDRRHANPRRRRHGRRAPRGRLPHRL